MIRMMEFSYGTVKYWMDELPPIHVPHCLQARDTVRAKTAKTFAATKVAMEIRLTKHASSYGLLGVSYVPEPDADDLQVSIDYTAGMEAEYADTILLYGKAYVGMQAYYLPLTQSRIIAALQDECALQAGRLHFCVAAEDEVGSSPQMFSALAEMLLALIVRRNENQTDAAMDDRVTEVFRASRLFAR